MILELVHLYLTHPEALAKPRPACQIAFLRFLIEVTREEKRDPEPALLVQTLPTNHRALIIT